MVVWGGTHDAGSRGVPAIVGVRIEEATEKSAFGQQRIDLLAHEGRSRSSLQRCGAGSNGGHVYLYRSRVEVRMNPYDSRRQDHSFS